MPAHHCQSRGTSLTGPTMVHDIIITCTKPCACFSQCHQVLNPIPLNPTPATCHKRKQKLRCNSRNAALQKLHCNFCSADVICTKSCAATNEKLHQESGAFLPLSCGFQLPRLGVLLTMGFAISIVQRQYLASVLASVFSVCLASI